MKYLKVFETETLQNEFRGGENYIEPHISCLEDGSKVKYNIYTKEERIYLSQPFTIESLGTGAITWNLTDGKTVKYSKNDGEWTSWDGTTAINVVAGDEVAFVGNNSSYFAGNTSPAVVCSANFNVKGNIMSLISETDFWQERTLTEQFTFGNFFRLQPVISAENLLLPATTLTKTCYGLMFLGTPLVLPPKVLPAPVLSEMCYIQMFRTCQNLQKCPTILATTMAKNSCNMMFAYCDSLIKTCEFPATTLAEGCYDNMFANCINLKKVCELPATTLATKCYSSMFINCQKLKTPPKIMAIDLTDATRCCDGMFAYCYSLEEAPELKPTVLYDHCYINMFRDCTSLRQLPNLPATTLASCCYQQMFHGCTGITTIPQNFLPITSLAYGCYTSMFLGCTGLTSVSSNLLPATTLAESCYQCMFMDCTNLTNASINLLATTMVTSCYESMFQGCTNLTVAPQLPATTLASRCYQTMFANCSSLTTSPELSAATLVEACYQKMFQNCTNLNNVKCLATDISATNCVDNWLSGVSATGTFIKDKTMSDWTTGASGIPTGWTVYPTLLASYTYTHSGNACQVASSSGGQALSALRQWLINNVGTDSSNMTTTVSKNGGEEIFCYRTNNQSNTILWDASHTVRLQVSDDEYNQTDYVCIDPDGNNTTYVIRTYSNLS